MQSHSRPAVFIQAGLKNTAIRNASAKPRSYSQAWDKGNCEAGRLGRLRAAASWGTRQGLGAARSSLVGPILGRPERRGLSSWSFPAAPSNRASLRPLQKAIALLFPTQRPKIHSQKASRTKTKPLVISRQFQTPGGLHTFLLIAVTDYLKGMKGS